MQAHLEAHTQQYDLVAIFGSYARLEAYSQSDYDVLILDEEFTGWNIYKGSTEAVEFSWPSDFQELHLICCSHSEFERRYNEGGEMVKEILEEGVAIHPKFGLADYP